MKRLLRLGVGAAVAGVLALSTGGAASAAESDNACTVFGAPHGEAVSRYAQTYGFSGTVNPGKSGRAASQFCKGPPG